MLLRRLLFLTRLKKGLVFEVALGNLDNSFAADEKNTRRPFSGVADGLVLTHAFSPLLLPGIVICMRQTCVQT